MIALVCLVMAASTLGVNIGILIHIHQDGQRTVQQTAEAVAKGEIWHDNLSPANLQGGDHNFNGAVPLVQAIPYFAS